MLKIDTLQKGKRIFNPVQEDSSKGDGIYDLTLSSITYENVNLRFTNTYLVPDDYRMRIDLISRDTLGDSASSGSLMKANSISNPFAIDTKFLLLIPNKGDIEFTFEKKNNKDKSSLSAPNTANDFRKVQQNKVFETSPSRRAFVESQNKANSPAAMQLPPNILQPGQNQVTIESGAIFLGRDAGGGSNQPISL
jgi:hypothetical protein